MTTSSANPQNAAGGAWGGGVFEILFILIVFICILFLAYFATRFVAGRASGRLKSRHIEIVDTLAAGVDAQFMIVRAGGELFLAAKSQKRLALLTKLEMTPAEAAAGAAGAPGFAESFRNILEGKLSRARPRQKEGAAESAAENAAEGASANDAGKSEIFRMNLDRIKDFSDATEKDKEQP